MAQRIPRVRGRMRGNGPAAMPRTIIEPQFTIEHLSILDSDGNLDVRPRARDRPGRAPAPVPRHAPRPAPRRAHGAAAAPGAHRHLRADQGPGGGPDGQRLHAPPDRLDGAVLPRDRRHALARLVHREDPALLLGPPRRADGPEPEQRDLPSPSRSPPRCRTRWASPTPRSTAATTSVVMAYCGDGATSEGDFHEAMNFAGVWHGAAGLRGAEQPVGDLGAAQEADPLRAPSPRRRWPTAFPGIQVDGNDVLAVYAASREAVERARARRRPDPDRVRHLSSGRAHHRRRSDQVPVRGGGEGVGAEGPAHPLHAPISRSGTSLEAGVEAASTRRSRRRRALRGGRRRPIPLAMFDHAYGEPPAALEAQRAEVAARLGSRPRPRRRRATRRRRPCAASGRPEARMSQAEHGEGAEPRAPAGDGARPRRARDRRGRRRGRRRLPRHRRPAAPVRRHAA